jgi:hypothetical protein
MNPRAIVTIALTFAGAYASIAASSEPLEAAPPRQTIESLASELIRRAEELGLDQHPQWLALLHYEGGWLPNRARSRAATPSFFLSEVGDEDPRAELRATLEAFLSPGAIVKDDEHAQCAFIARRHWLITQLDISEEELRPVSCDHYTRWREGLDAVGLTLVFPEGFMSNPGSIFGHTLLRIDSRSNHVAGEILGYAVDFAANTGDDRGLAYIFKGASGRYPAFFGVHPYYEQLKRYSDWENRDIWEYRLDIEPSELDFLLMHLWELRGIEFPYYFFTKNCSYELLRLLETAIEDLDASSHFRGPVLPVETVRAITSQPGKIEGTRYRPSPETRLTAELRSLSRKDRDLVLAIASGRMDPSSAESDSIPVERRARILSAAYDQLRYEYLAGNTTDRASRGLSRQILIARSRVEIDPTDEAALPRSIEVPSTRPDQGHRKSSLSLSAGWRDHESYVDLRLRPALHDLMDPGGGYLPYTEIRVLDTLLRIYPESETVRLQELTLLEIVSLKPRTQVLKPLAWRMKTGLETRRLPASEGLADSPVWATEAGIGLSWDPLSSTLLYGLAEARLDLGPDLEHKVDFAPGVRLGVFSGGSEARWKAHLFAEVNYFAINETNTQIRGVVQARLTMSRNSALVAEGSINRSYHTNWAGGVMRLKVFF